MNVKTPKDFLNQFAAAAGPGFEALGTEIRQQLRSAAQTTFEKMDFVPREDFEAQKAVLLRTREKLEALELQMAALEAKLQEIEKTH
jgi:BMFP domain-containing protein YqiC